jgi:DNA-binding NarL/FixJ family response regulator
VIRLLMADDHGIMREGLKQLFNKVADIVVAGEAVDGTQVLAALQQDRFDLLLLDMSMPEISGIDLIEEVRLRRPTLPILVLSMHHEPQIVKRALKVGAGGYISKDTNDPERLLTAIRRVAAGGRYLDPGMAERVIFEAGTETIRQHQALSKREHEIFMLLAQGLGVTEIGIMLFISSKTVSTHKAHLMEKMDLKTNADLVRYALINGLLE